MTAESDIGTAPRSRDVILADVQRQEFTRAMLRFKWATTSCCVGWEGNWQLARGPYGFLCVKNRDEFQRGHNAQPVSKLLTSKSTICD